MQNIFFFLIVLLGAKFDANAIRLEDAISFSHSNDFSPASTAEMLETKNLVRNLVQAKSEGEESLKNYVQSLSERLFEELLEIFNMLEAKNADNQSEWVNTFLRMRSEK